MMKIFRNVSTIILGNLNPMLNHYHPPGKNRGLPDRSWKRSRNFLKIIFEMLTMQESFSSVSDISKILVLLSEPNYPSK